MLPQPTAAACLNKFTRDGKLGRADQCSAVRPHLDYPKSGDDAIPSQQSRPWQSRAEGPGRPGDGCQRPQIASRKFSKVANPAIYTAKLPLPGAPGKDMELAYLDNQNTSGSPTLLLLHGLFDHKGTWSSLCPHLDRHFRLLAPDLIGFGHSSKPLLDHLPVPYRYSPPMHAEYLCRFILQQGLDDVILVGNSLGGGIALYMALQFPQLQRRTRGLVLIDAAGYPQQLPGHIRELGGWLGTLMNNPFFHWLAFRSGLVSMVVQKTFERAFYDRGLITPELKNSTLEILKSSNIFYAYKTAAQNILPAGHPEVVKKFSQITCPTLLIWGREDRIIPVLSALRFKEDIPHANLHIIEQCGHSPQLEHPAQVARLIATWAEDNL